MTHSVGHYLNLRHIWGDASNCSGSHLVEDTPPAAGPNVGAPTYPHKSCPDQPYGDMFMNFMDYVDDEAMFMFTKGQVARMREALQRSAWGFGNVDVTVSHATCASQRYRLRDSATTREIDKRQNVTLGSKMRPCKN